MLYANICRLMCVVWYNGGSNGVIFNIIDLLVIQMKSKGYCISHKRVL